MNITGIRLKKLRNILDVSQADVAKAIGVSRTAYVKYETGASKPVRKLNELANYFNVSADYLLGNDDTKTELSLSQKQTKLLEGFDSLNTEGQNTLLSMLNFLRTTNSTTFSNNQQSPVIHGTGDVNNSFVAFGGNNSVSQTVTR